MLFPSEFRAAEARLVLSRPYGTRFYFLPYPALERWAKLFRPCGAGFLAGAFRSQTNPRSYTTQGQSPQLSSAVLTRARRGVCDDRAVPEGTRSFFPAYPGLNHPNTRKSGARWGPRYALGYSIVSPLRGWSLSAFFRCGKPIRLS